MIFPRSTFFLLLFLIIVLPIPLYKLFWLAGSRETVGTMYFQGHGNLGSMLGISTYPVIRFIAGRDTVVFNGNVDIPLKPGEKVSVRYQRSDPRDAKVNMFSSIWGDTMAYVLGPLIMLLVVFFHPDLVPRRSKVVLGRKPLIRLID